MLLPVGASEDRGPSAWSFLLVLPPTYHSLFSFSATAVAAGKGFWGNGGRYIDTTWSFTTPVLAVGTPITGETGITNSAKGGFGSTGARTTEAIFSERKGGQSLHTPCMLIYSQ